MEGDMQEFENLKYEIRQKRPERRMNKILIALDLYEKALERQEAEAKTKRSWRERVKGWFK